MDNKPIESERIVVSGQKGLLTMMGKLMPFQLKQFSQVEQAWTLILQCMTQKHAKNLGKDVILEGSSFHANYNALIQYLEGNAVTYIIPETQAVDTDDSLNISSQLCDELSDLEFDLDFTAQEASSVAPDHPFVELKHLTQLATQETISITSADVSRANRFIKELTRRLSGHSHFTVLKNTRINQLDEHGVVVLDNPDGQTRLQAELVVQEQGQQLVISHAPQELISDPAPTLEQAQVAHEHQKMVRAQQYHQRLERVSSDFYSKPSVEADRLFAKTNASRPQIADQNRPKVVVVGLGPTGLMAAIRAYQKGAHVTAIEQRSSYTRNNIFRLYPEIVQRLKQLFVESESEIQGLSKDHPLRAFLDAKSIAGPRTSKDIEGEYYTMTTQDFELLSATWLKLMAAKDPQNCQVLVGWQYAPGSIGSQAVQNGCIGIRRFDRRTQNQPFDPNVDLQIPVDILIGSDGYSSKIRSDSNIQTESHSSSKPYATITYHSDRADALGTWISHLDSADRVNDGFDINELKRRGWNLDKAPIVRYFTTGDHPYLGVEIPETLFDDLQELDKQVNEARTQKRFGEVYLARQSKDRMIEDWCQPCMKLFHKQADLVGLVKKQATAFRVELQAATQPIYTRADGLTVILAGDSLQSAHFQTWHGAVTGMNEAEDIGRFLEKLMANPACKQEALKSLSVDLKLKTLHLHERPFGFTAVNGDDFDMKPNSSMTQFKSKTRCEAIQDNRNMGAAQSVSEAHAKMGRRRNR